MADTFQYFAYGSNMLSHRLMARCDSARLTTVATASGYKIGVSKQSIDKSGKATLIHTDIDTDIVTGAVFEISADQADAPDASGGPGYLVHDPFDVTCNRTSEVIPARTHMPTDIRTTLRHMAGTSRSCWPVLLNMSWMTSTGQSFVRSGTTRMQTLTGDPAAMHSRRWNCRLSLTTAHCFSA